MTSLPLWHPILQRLTAALVDLEQELTKLREEQETVKRKRDDEQRNVNSNCAYCLRKPAEC